jgi:hypothetical protein
MLKIETERSGLNFRPCELVGKSLERLKQAAQTEK